MGSQTEKTRQARMAWMLYFNRALLESGVIGDREHSAMEARIREAYSRREPEKA